jgi:hypothetical protein
LEGDSTSSIISCPNGKDGGVMCSTIPVHDTCPIGLLKFVGPKLGFFKACLELVEPSFVCFIEMSSLAPNLQFLDYVKIVMHLLT